MSRLLCQICILILVGCASSVPSSNRMDDGMPLPILLSQYSATDTTVVLVGGPPPDPMPEPSYLVPEEMIPLDGEPQPIPRIMISPRYPEGLRHVGIEGIVWMKLLISSHGDVSQAHILKSDNDGFNQAALRAAIQWKFTPAYVGDSAISCWAALPMRFRLR
jgi:TonB family protein